LSFSFFLIILSYITNNIFYTFLFRKCDANSVALFTAPPILAVLPLLEPKLSPAKNKPGDTSQNGWGYRVLGCENFHFFIIGRLDDEKLCEKKRKKKKEK
jgi:hypothetical protein